MSTKYRMNYVTYYTLVNFVADLGWKCASFDSMRIASNIANGNNDDRKYVLFKLVDDGVCVCYAVVLHNESGYRDFYSDNELIHYNKSSERYDPYKNEPYPFKYSLLWIQSKQENKGYGSLLLDYVLKNIPDPMILLSFWGNIRFFSKRGAFAIMRGMQYDFADCIGCNFYMFFPSITTRSDSFQDFKKVHGNLIDKHDYEFGIGCQTDTLAPFEKKWISRFNKKNNCNDKLLDINMTRQEANKVLHCLDQKL